MKIAIEARALSRKGGGVRTYVYNLVKNLLDNKELDVSLLYDQAKDHVYFPRAHEFIVQRHSGLLLNWWLNRQIVTKLNNIKPELAHFTKAAIPKRKTIPTVVTIYDVIPIIFPESQKLSGRIYWPKALRHAATSSDHVLTISEASKQDIIKLFGVAADKITVTPLAIDTETFRPINDPAEINRVRDSYKLPNSYILYVGTVEPRKNVPTLIRAFAKIAKDIKQDLVIAGAAYKGEEEVLKTIQEHNLTNRVHRLDFVAQKDLPALYAGADLFAWPSIYEGWGFPPQEAMACGVPTIVSNGGALAEVVGEAGKVVAFNTDNVPDRTHDDLFEQSFADQIANILTNQGLRDAMKDKGLQQAKANTWQEVAQKTLAVYKEVVSHS